MKKINFAIIIAAAGFFLNVNPASAILFPDLNEAIEDANRAVQESVNRVNQQACDNLKSKITTKISWLDGRFSFHMQKYGTIAAKVTEVINGAGEKGYDVENLSILRERFIEKVNNYQHDFVLTKNNLVGAKTNVCLAPNTNIGSSSNAVKSNLLLSRSNIQRMREDVRDIKRFYEEKMRPEIAAISLQRYREE